MKVYYDALRYLIGITAEEDRLLGKNKIFLNLCKYLRKKYKVKKEGSLLRVILSKDKEIVVGVNKNSFSLNMSYKDYPSSYSIYFEFDGNIIKKDLNPSWEKYNSKYYKNISLANLVKFYKEICEEVQKFLSPNSIRFMGE